MSKKNPYRHVGPSTLLATENAIVAFDQFLMAWRGGLPLNEDSGEVREERLSATLGKAFDRKRKRMLARFDCKCQVCSAPVIETRAADPRAPNTAVIDMFVLPEWGGPKQELNMTLVCWSCGLSGAVRADMDAEKVVADAKARMKPYLEEQNALNR